MARHKPAPMIRDHAIARLRKARSYLMTAIRDLERADRVDALDSMDFARKAVDQARNVIRETLP